jgi:hypothetical protein
MEVRWGGRVLSRVERLCCIACACSCARPAERKSERARASARARERERLALCTAPHACPVTFASNADSTMHV